MNDDIFTSLVVVLVLVFGLWQFTSTLSTLADFSFGQLRIASILYVSVLVVTFWRLGLKSGGVVGPPVEYPTSLHRLYTGDSRWVFRLGLAASLVAGYWLTDRFALFWWLGIGLLLWNWLAAREPAAPLAGPTTVDKRREKMIVWLAVLLMALICLLHRRPSGDDAFFMNIIVSALDHPDRVLWSVDGMHGDAKLPLMSPIYRFSSYELFIATISSFTKIPGADLYYLVFPPLFGGFIVIANWVAIRCFLREGRVWAVVVLLIVYWVWGTNHTYGEYAITRLFSGKATVAPIWIPILVYLSVRFSEHPSWRGWMLLLLAQAATLGMSSTALAVAPLTVCLVLLGFWRGDGRGARVVVAGASSGIYLVILGLLVLIELRATGAVESMHVAHKTGGAEDGIKQVLGRADLRLHLGLLCLFVLAIAPGTYQWRRASLVLVMFGFVMNPWVSGLLSEVVAYNLYWRVFWSVPFPLIMAGAVALVLYTGSMWVAQWGSIRAGAAMALSGVGLFALGGPWNVSLDSLGKPGYRVGPGYKYAKYISAKTNDQDLVWAPDPVSVWIPTLHSPPRVFEVRESYLRDYFSEFYSHEEYRTRYFMVRFLRGSRRISEKDVPRALSEVEGRNITVIVIDKELPWYRRFSRELLKRDFEPLHNSRKFLIVKKLTPAAIEARGLEFTCVRLVALSEVDDGVWTSGAELVLLDAEGKPIDPVGWRVQHVDSEELTGDHRAENFVDGRLETIWHTQWSGRSPSHPHEVQIDLSAPHTLSGFRYFPRQDAPQTNGNIKDFKFYLSEDCEKWQLVASGSFPKAHTPVEVRFRREAQKN